MRYDCPACWLHPRLQSQLSTHGRVSDGRIDRNGKLQFHRYVRHVYYAVRWMYERGFWLMGCK